MKRFCLSFLSLLALILPLAAQAQVSDNSAQWGWDDMWLRNTSAATGSVVRQPNWAFGTSHGGTTVGFADSTVFRKGATTNALTDTSIAYKVDDFAFPPTLHTRGGQYGSRNAAHSLANGVAGNAQDSVIVDTTDATPWLAIRVRQDTTSYAFSGSTGLDSAGVAAQISYDGINWFSVSGSPTRAFVSVAITSGEDGLQPPLMTATESSPGVDAVQFDLQCQPTVFNVGTAFILNRTLCMAGAYVRFLVSAMDGSGQWKVELGHWRNTLNSQ